MLDDNMTDDHRDSLYGHVHDFNYIKQLKLN